MFENESRESSSGPKKPDVTTAAGVEGVVPGDSVATVTGPGTEKSTNSAKTPEQAPAPKKEGLSAAEKLKLKEEAMGALKQLTKKAEGVVSAPDEVAALGIVPSQADLKSPDRFRLALRERLTYFHPDSVKRKMTEILGDVGKVFPELANEAHLARLACDAAARRLTNAESFLRNDSRRVKYLGDKYGIYPGVPEGQPATTKAGVESPQRQSTAPRVEQTSPKPDSNRQRTPSPDWAQDARENYAQGFQDWRKTYDSDAWQEFARSWEDRKPPAEKRKTMGQRVESLLEQVRERQGQRRLNEMAQLGVEALKEVKDLVSLKHILELILTFYDVLKTKYPLKENRGNLPNEIVMLSLKGMLSRLNRPPDGNARWRTQRDTESWVKQSVESARIILDYLKPKSPLGGPLGASA